MEISDYYKDKTTGIVLEPKPRLTLAATFLAEKECKEILDVGGNDGRFATMLKNIDNDIIIDSVDLSSQLSTKAILKGILRNCYDFDVTKAWPLTSELYDGMHLGAIIEHVFDYKTLFSECFRVLRSGGWLFISTPNMACIRHRYEVLLGQMTSWYRTFGHIRMWTGNYLKGILIENGFIVTDIKWVWKKIIQGQ
jgi:2-polyprenyl-3-methyl-5-hydroxy-6-metoxy-1,4-benzoquinol methylase